MYSVVTVDDDIVSLAKSRTTERHNVSVSNYASFCAAFCRFQRIIIELGLHDPFNIYLDLLKGWRRLQGFMHMMTSSPFAPVLYFPLSVCKNQAASAMLRDIYLSFDCDDGHGTYSKSVLRTQSLRCIFPVLRKDDRQRTIARRIMLLSVSYMLSGIKTAVTI